ncbi:MAG: OmpA family protein [Woeseiaceae bacterium]|nr:OmpA family protein [Woeseiaceae bacterium]
MRTLICAFAATAIALAGASTAFADAEAGQGYFSAMGTYIDDDTDRNAEDGIKGGHFGMGKAVSEHVNIEFLLQIAALKNLDQDQLGIGFDVQRVFLRSESFSPYLFGGVGYMQIDQLSAGPQRDGGMISGGAGFYLDMFSGNVALRGEWRHRVDTVAERSLKDNLFSLGLQIPFGAGTPRWVDSDGDGVEDRSDNCPNTPAGAPVDSFGCERDSDGDGVKDSVDRCPGTPKGVSVDASGCPNDSDGDGVTDDKDQCPGTPAGQPVDANGCELDDDGDGVVNRLDQCPGTPAGTQVDIRGCEIKEEIRLEGVNFQSNSDRLLPGAESILNDAAATLEKNPTIKVEVAGHTDSDGAADYNESLSARRAQTVFDYLANAGIAVDRMTVRGYGESQPIADNATAAGKAENRRVVLRITER